MLFQTVPLSLPVGYCLGPNLSPTSSLWKDESSVLVPASQGPTTVTDAELRGDTAEGTAIVTSLFVTGPHPLFRVHAQILTVSQENGRERKKISIAITNQHSCPSSVNRNWLEFRQELQARLYWGPCCCSGEWKQTSFLARWSLSWGKLVPYVGWG